MLRSHHTAWRYADFDAVSGRLRPLSVWRTLVRRPVTAGWYGQIAKHQVVVFCANGGLSLAIDGKIHIFDNSIGVEWKTLGSTRHIGISAGSVILLDAVYAPELGARNLANDLTAGAEEEHFDFGLFIFNLSRDRQRRDQICLSHG
jgi:hypothetical protein